MCFSEPAVGALLLACVALAFVGGFLVGQGNARP